MDNDDLICEVDLRAQLEQVTEECGELTQACMKLIRAIGNGNPCGISEKDATNKVVEEIADLDVAISYLTVALMDRVPYDIYDRMFDISREKTERWKRRLADAKANDDGSGVAGSACCDGDYCDLEGV